MINLKNYFQEKRIKKTLVCKNPDCIDAIFENHADKLYHYALFLSKKKESAEEILQNVLLKIIKNTSLLKKIKNLKAYLYKSIKNEFINHIKKEEKENKLPLLFDGISKGVKIEEILSVQEALQRLPHEQREVIILKIYQDLNFSEIAELMKISINTAASRYRYGLEKLKENLGGMYE